MPKKFHRLSIDLPNEHLPALDALVRSRNSNYKRVVLDALRLLAIFDARKKAGHVIYTMAPDGVRSDFEIL